MPSVNLDHFTGNMPCQVRTKKSCQVGNILRLTKPFQNDLIQCGSTDNLIRVLHHFSLDQAGGDGIDIDIVFTQFFGNCLCQANDAGFGSSIVCLPEFSTEPVDGGDVDDLARLLLPEQRLPRTWCGMVAAGTRLA